MQNTSVAERALSGRRSTRSERPAAAAAATNNECGAALGAPSTHARPPLSASGGTDRRCCGMIRPPPSSRSIGWQWMTGCDPLPVRRKWRSICAGATIDGRLIRPSAGWIRSAARMCGAPMWTAQRALCGAHEKAKTNTSRASLELLLFEVLRLSANRSTGGRGPTILSEGISLIRGFFAG